ncbi:murein transglycosylase A [Sphingomonas lacunae]|uniref:peptidoglycan lytic exotransglycosylase n=2 Tax=Sphingomonas lacunae TaxID=2698828 RepID=A0A6M4AXL3_9SPHN|nr:murein transglycosylase A [Sphingomonas lacunae]
MKRIGRLSGAARLAVGGAVAFTLSACGATIIPDGGRATAATVPTPSAPVPTPAPAATVPVPVPTVPTPTATGVPVGANAIATGIAAGSDLSTIGLTPEMASRALAAFRISCNSVTRRSDSSGLTLPGDWANACAAAPGWTDSDAIRFFATHFRTVQVGDGRGLATGYYEPEIVGCRTRTPQCQVPVYGVPSDLVEVDLGQFSAELAGKRLRGRIDGSRLIPYHDRTAIDGGALANRNLEIAWAADPVEFFFLQIQGSGRLRMADGSVMRIGYAGQNGREYVGIGRLLRDRGVLQPGEASMQGLMSYLRRQPDGGASVMRENGSWIFFRELTGAGPLGSLGVPVTGRASVAADPLFVPLGAPVFLMMDRPEASGLWIAQDTGGAIRGANRFDTFWGAGEEARTIAGGMSARGTALLLLPTASVERLLAPR